MTNISIVMSIPICSETPTTRMTKALQKYINPTKSKTIEKALEAQANKRKRTCIQKQFGEILTEMEAIERLKAEKFKK